MTPVLITQFRSPLVHPKTYNKGRVMDHTIDDTFVKVRETITAQTSASEIINVDVQNHHLVLDDIVYDTASKYPKEKGAWSRVMFLTKQSDGSRYVLKLMRDKYVQQGGVDRFVKEVAYQQVAASCNLAPSILSFGRCTIHEFLVNNSFYILMAHSGQNLSQPIQTEVMRPVYRVHTQLLRNCGLVKIDTSPENIVFNKRTQRIHLIDFDPGAETEPAMVLRIDREKDNLDKREANIKNRLTPYLK